MHRIDLTKYENSRICARDDSALEKIRRNLRSYPELKEAHEFLPRIFVAGDTVANDESLLHSLHITHILNTAAVISIPSPFESSGFKYLNLFLQDVTSQPIELVVPRALLWVQDALDSSPSSRVLIHCRMGRSRSVTITTFYALWKAKEYFRVQGNGRVTADMILSYFTSLRSIVLLNANFLGHLRSWKAPRFELDGPGAVQAWALVPCNIHDPLFHPQPIFPSAFSLDYRVSILFFDPSTMELCLVLARDNPQNEVTDAAESAVRFYILGGQPWSWYEAEHSQIEATGSIEHTVHNEPKMVQRHQKEGVREVDSLTEILDDICGITSTNVEAEGLHQTHRAHTPATNTARDSNSSIPRFAISVLSSTSPSSLSRNAISRWYRRFASTDRGTSFQPVSPSFSSTTQKRSDRSESNHTIPPEIDESTVAVSQQISHIPDENMVLPWPLENPTFDRYGTQSRSAASKEELSKLWFKGVRKVRAIAKVKRASTHETNGVDGLLVSPETSRTNEQ